jgi:colanic acid/amylovoran biosynthesis glycosyltransferase
VKIAYLTALFPFAPEEQFFEPEVRSLAARTPLVVIAVRPPSRTCVYRNLGAESRYVPLFGVSVVARALREIARAPVRAARALAEIAFGSSSVRARVVNLAVVPKALAVAHEVRRLGIDHVHAAWLTTPATVALIVHRLTGVPFSLTAHQHDIFSGNLLARKIAAARFTRVISRRNRDALVARLPSRLAARCVAEHIGVEVPAEPAQPPPRVPRILCAARLIDWKGHRYLVRALRLLRERGVAFTCDFAGDGPLRARIASSLARADLSEQVRMLGNVPHADLVAALNRGDYDLFALASTERGGEHEGIPVAAMEAMAAAVPVVSTRTGSLDELVGPAEGALVPQRDPDALAGALEELLLDAGRRRRAGESARARIIASFETSRTSDALLELIRGSSG